ncbi:ubiquitin hydrolase, putative [Leishmania panamensis]|uniref:Ubiquitin hydrolase, putative n=1 Tax=Leishmania panamensis TaxID=5679 RepID=A0A088RK97_LEIPA|nr:ubiquitin hydrolase, putative [Leishmania panamensis]AIN96348.1 ubiquitin hydrolase, putative [Leishmania panamensis]
MAKLSEESASAGAADTQVERDNTMIHQEPELEPAPPSPPAELVVAASFRADQVSFGDPVEFILGRVDTIELWRAKVVRLNLTQIGVSLMRGVLRHCRLSTPPMRIFDAVESTPPAAQASVQSLGPSPVVQPPLLPYTALESRQMDVQVAEHSEAVQTSVQGVVPVARWRATYQPPNHHCSAHPFLQFSVARRALVQTASRASVPLYIGMLTAFIGYGVASMYSADTEADSLSAGGAAAEESVKPPASTPGAAAATGFQMPGRRLQFTAEMNNALHEVHRAAAEVTCMINHEAKEMHALATAALQSTGKVTRCLTDEDERVQDLRQAQLGRSCRHLCRLVANLYSLVSLLDFFAVEGASLPTQAPAPNTAAAAIAAFHPSDGEVARVMGKVVGTGTSGAGHSDTSKTNVSLLSSSSARRAVAMRMEKHGAQTTPLAPRTDSNTLCATPTSPTATKPIATAIALTAANQTFTAAPAHAYTTERFHKLFGASGHLPQSVWMVFSPVAETLSQFAVSWSLTTGDARSRQAFNTAACAILGEDQRCLLLQMHRLCTRFIVLRHQVYALHPVNPLLFKVKQMLEWNGLFDADKPDAWSYNNGGIDRCDLHTDLLHNTYAHGPQWCVNSCNKMALQAVIAGPYTTTARNSALRGIKEVSTFSPNGIASAGANDGANATLSGLLTESPSSITVSPTQGSSVAALSQLSAVPGYVGLRNSGNTCFLNSVVQLLGSATLFCDDLIARVQDTVFGHSAHADHRTTVAEHAVDSKAMETLFTKYGCRLAMALLLGELQWRGKHHHKRHAVLPDYLTPHLPPPFDDYRQHDASEFWHALMDNLDVPSQPEGAVVASWFSGRTATTITCVTCQRRRLHNDTFWDLSIPLLRSASAPSAPAAGTDRLVSQVEVHHFARATAVTTTYADTPTADLSGNMPIAAAASAGLETAERTEEGAEERTNEKTAPTLRHTVVRGVAEPHSVTSPLPPSMVAANEACKTLQHLLLYALHPTLNKELLYGSNALDCEHCRRCTNTELTTHLVAEIEVEGGTGADVVAADVPDKGVGVVQHTCVTSGCVAAVATGELHVEGESPKPLAAGAHSPPHGGSACVEKASALPQPLTSTAAGGGLPYYLAIQLNRFAYQRVTQSCDKIADGVPLNEVIIVPVYPEITALNGVPAFPACSQGPNRPPGVTNEEDGDASTQHEDNHHHNTPSHRAPTAPRSATPAAPVWIAYRLQSIIIHSGFTPSSGHYFTLTRRPVAAPAQVNIDDINHDEDEHHVSADADLRSMRAYVEELGAALTSCLSTETHFSNAEVVQTTVDAGGASSRCTDVEGAGQQSKDGPTLVSFSAGTGETVRSPTLSSLPTLPTAAVSVSGGRLYENWVMLNDSSVQIVEPDTMRHILHGYGGGVYSAWETPYIILYEKVPVAYEGAVSRDVLPGKEEQTTKCIADPALSVAARLQRLWESRHASLGARSATSVGDTAVKPIHFAPEVLQIFNERLKNDTACSAALNTASHAANKCSSASVDSSGSRSRHTLLRTVEHQGASATTLRTAVASPLGARKDTSAFLSDSSSTDQAFASPRPRRLMSTPKGTRRYSVNPNHHSAEEHRKHSGAEHGAAALSSSCSDASLDTDDE